MFSKLYFAVKAYWVKYWRTRQVTKVFVEAHAVELRETAPAMWPVVMAKQAGEMAAIRAGNFDAAMVRQGPASTQGADRQSWQWPFLPASSQRLSMPLLKPTPYNLRRMSRTPIPHRAINIIKSAILSQPWDIVDIDDVAVDDTDEQKDRMRIGRFMFAHPNVSDSFQTFVEQGLEDFLTFGALVVELGVTLNPERPLKLWPVNVESIRLYAAWTESNRNEVPHYVQMTGLKGERGAVTFYDDETLYMRDNPSTDTPFGLGKMEIAFASVNAFLGVQEMSGRAGADQIHKTFLWWEHPQSETAYQTVRRYIQNDLEGQAKLSIIGGMKKPEVIDVNPVRAEDLLLPWQELLIRVIASAFDMSAMALGVEHDVNRAMGKVLDDKDFRTAVVPVAQRMAEAFTRRILHAKLGWYDLEFKFLNIEDPDPQTKMGINQQLYVTNATTPNDIRRNMKMEPLLTPFAELTQAEVTMLMTVMQAMIAKDQQAAMQPSYGMPMGTPPGGGAERGGGAMGGEPPKPPSLKPPTPPHMPKPVTIGNPGAPPTKAKLNNGTLNKGFSAKAVALMPVNQMQDAMRMFGVSASELAKQVDKEDPNMLSKLADETRAYLDEQIDQEKDDKNVDIADATLVKIQKKLRVEKAKDAKRPRTYIGYMGDKANIGKPGDMNPVAGYKGKTPA